MGTKGKPPILRGLLLAITVWVPLLTQAAETDEQLAQLDALPPCTEYPAWLNEVRAQRKAWEAWRDVVKKSVGHSPQPVPPLQEAVPGPETAQQEPPDRQHYHDRRGQRREENEARREAHRKEIERLRDERDRLWQQYFPYGWDNPWYYRGY